MIKLDHLGQKTLIAINHELHEDDMFVSNDMNLGLLDLLCIKFSDKLALTHIGVTPYWKWIPLNPQHHINSANETNDPIYLFPHYKWYKWLRQTKDNKNLEK